MTTRALILSLIACGLVASCSLEFPEAAGYETPHAVAHLSRPITGFNDYQKFVAENP